MATHAAHAATDTRATAMRRAIELAARGLGSTSPNPVVGCVITDARGAVVGEGWHQRAGGPHAEVHALRAAGTAARGGTAYVTLEPCNHTGRTGPCAQALIEAGVTRVVYAVSDPNPQASGGGATLRAAGIATEAGLLEQEAEEGNAAWLTSVRRGRPHVLWKYAATLDGRIAAADGTSRWISSPESRADVHRLRAEADAVVVGSGTLRADDPHLAVRGRPGTDPADQPLRVVLDTRATVRPGARVLDDAAPTLIAVAEDADTGHLPGVDLVRLPADENGISVHALLAELHRRGVRSVLLEGGPTLAGAFVAAGAVDKVVGYLAPVLLGAGRTALGDAGIDTIADALRLRITETVRIGPDLRVTAVPEAVPTAPQGALSVHRNRRRTWRGHRRRAARRGLPLPPARPRRHRGCQARRLHRRQRRVPDRRGDRRRRVHRRRHAGDPEPLQPRHPGTGLPGQPGAPHGPRRPARRPPGPRARGRHRRDPLPHPSEHWELVKVALPAHLARYVVEKGSITVDGVSLTVVEAAADHFTISLIPTTLALTTLGIKQPGDPVNLEVDVLAKYVERLLAAGVDPLSAKAGEERS
ncbi:hypothetical protein GCM10020254_68430 [Streptomyces goshikiensis]